MLLEERGLGMRRRKEERGKRKEERGKRKEEKDNRRRKVLRENQKSI